MNENDIATIDAMEARGGSFVKALGAAARHADRFNLQKIKETWPEYWKQYSPHGEHIASSGPMPGPEVITGDLKN